MTGELREAFLRDVADAVSDWRRHMSQLSAEDRLTDHELDLALSGIAQLILVTLDGGTKLSDHGRRVFLTDSDGEVIAEGLHEYLPEHLDDVLRATGRLGR